MHTNGGCHCVRTYRPEPMEMMEIRRSLLLWRKLVAELEAEIARLRQ